MRTVLKNLFGIASALIGIAVFVAAFMAYFVTSMDRSTRQILDGLGRPLAPTPLFFRFFLGADRMWAGVSWFVLDFIWFFGGIYLAFTLFSVANKLGTTQGERDG